MVLALQFSDTWTHLAFDLEIINGVSRLNFIQHCTHTIDPMMVKWLLTLPGDLFAFELFVHNPMASLASTYRTALAENSHNWQHELPTYGALEYIGQIFKIVY